MAAACCRSTEEYAKKTFPGVQVGLSENSVPLNPMVNDYYPY